MLSILLLLLQLLSSGVKGGVENPDELAFDPERVGAGIARGTFILIAERVLMS